MRIKGSDLKRIIKEEIGRMSEASGAEYYKQPPRSEFGGSDTWQEDEYERPGRSHDAYEFRYGLKFPSSHPDYGQDLGSARAGKEAYMAWKRSKSSQA